MPVIQYRSRVYPTHSSVPGNQLTSMSLAGLPGVVDGDHLFAMLHASNLNLSPRWVPPAGWAEVISARDATRDISLFHKIAHGEPGNYVFNISAETASYCGGFLICYTGASRTLALDSAGASFRYSATDPVADAINVTDANAALLFFNTNNKANVPDLVPPAGMTVTADTGQGASFGYGAHSCCQLIPSGAGNTGLKYASLPSGDQNWSVLVALASTTRDPTGGALHFCEA